MKLFSLSYFLCFFLSSSILAQETKIFVDDIKTLRLKVAGEENRLPILNINKNEKLEISFDDLTHDYRRYTYRVEHCTYDFKISSELFESEYLSTPSNEEPITFYRRSLNTSVLYTHYAFSFPNITMRPLLSGNYRLSIWRETEDGDKECVAETFFALLEPLVDIKSRVSFDTEIDYRAKHQQLSLGVDLSRVRGLTNPQDDIKLYVLQNRRWDNVAINPSYSFQKGNELLWEHTKELIFEAGNEYRKMEILSTRYTTRHIEKIYKQNGKFHAEVMLDIPRINYLYDEDQNGRSVIRSDDYIDDDVEADYIYTHFTLHKPLIEGERIYLNGRWTGETWSPLYELKYNVEKELYEACVLLKQGYYNYQYLTRSLRSPEGKTNTTEGNFYQTENEYTVLVYLSSRTDRYDRLIGTRQLHSSSY